MKNLNQNTLSKVVTIKFHKSLQKYTNGVSFHTLEADSYYSLITNCCNLFPDLLNLVRHLGRYANNQNITLLRNKKPLATEDMLLPPSGDLVLIPLLYGGDNAVSAIIGIAILAVVVWNPSGLFLAFNAAGAFTGLTTLGTLMVGVGINLVLGAVLSSKPEAKPQRLQEPDVNTRTNNDAYEGLTNTVSTNQSLPLNYGQMRIAGQLISGYIETIAHGQGDVIQVRNYI